MFRWRWIVAGSIALLIALVVLWNREFSLPPPQSVLLPGGTMLTFAGVSYGRTGQVPPAESWKRIVSFLPYWFLDKLNLSLPMKIPVATNHLLIWFLDTPRNSPFAVQGPGVIVGVVDENGAECFSPSFLPWIYMGGPSRPSYQAIELAAFPRRAKSFKLRFYSEEPSSRKLTRLGEMTVPNPAARGYPEWQPSSLPVTCTNHGVEVSLTKLFTGRKIGGEGVAETNEEVWGASCFTFKRNGKISRDWTIDMIEFSDAAGNETRPSSWGNSQSHNEEMFFFRAPLWPAEAAWKLKVLCKHRSNAKFDPEDLWTIPQVPLPALNASNSLNLKTNLHGANLSLLSLTDENSMLPAATSKDFRRIRLDFSVPSIPTELRCDILGVLPDGNKKNSAPIASSAGSYSTSTFMVPVSTKTITIRFAVYPALTAEFLAKAVVAPPRKATPPR